MKQIRDQVDLVRYTCRSLEDAETLLGSLGDLVGATVAAQRIVRRTRSVRRQLAAEVRCERRVFYPVWKDPWMAVSRASFPAAMLEAVGGKSIFAEHGVPYPEVTLQEVKAREPDVVLLPDEPWRFVDADRELFAATPAGRTGAVHCLPGRWAAWYGSRMEEGLRGLFELIQGFVPAV